MSTNRIPGRYPLGSPFSCRERFEVKYSQRPLPQTRDRTGDC
jgi:hypothetical protein